LGSNPLPDIPAADHPAAHEIIGVVRRLADDDNVGDIAAFHNEQNLGGKFDDSIVRRLVAYALQSEAPVGSEARFDVRSLSEIVERPYATWIVREVMPASGLAVIYGGPGSGKTFLMLDMAMAICRGIKWHGRRVKRGVVVYVAGEGALRSRVEAYMRHHNMTSGGYSGFFCHRVAGQFA
jgi:hypothetical protein